MKVHRFLKEIDFLSREFLSTDRDWCRQLSTVLKLKPGEQIVVTDGKGEEVLIGLEMVSSREVRGVVIDRLRPKRENDLKTELAMAILKKENFELVVQKATELGIKKIVPIVTTRTIKTGLNLDRLNKIVAEALELSGRVNLPQIEEPKLFIEYLKQKDGKVGSVDRVIFDGRGENASEKIFSQNDRLALVGPEGGFTDEELSLARASGFKIVSLSPLTWRGETAGIVASFLLARNENKD